jgi:hypothetical protein
MTRNLEKLRHHISDYGALTESQGQVVDGRITELEHEIEKEPKTKKWKLRARIGPRKRWYQEVAEKSETF